MKWVKYSDKLNKIFAAPVCKPTDASHATAFVLNPDHLNRHKRGNSIAKQFD
jgi:hypothetical protein